MSAVQLDFLAETLAALCRSPHMYCKNIPEIGCPAGFVQCKDVTKEHWLAYAKEMEVLEDAPEVAQILKSTSTSEIRCTHCGYTMSASMSACVPSTDKSSWNKWTHKVPTVSGYYWVQHYRTKDAVIGRVYKDKDGILVYYLNGKEQEVRMLDFMQWAGPIPQPYTE